jgi:hypothetical protein
MMRDCQIRGVSESSWELRLLESLAPMLRMFSEGLLLILKHTVRSSMELRVIVDKAHMLLF